MAYNEELVALIQFVARGITPVLTALGTVAQVDANGVQVIFDGSSLAVPVKVFGGFKVGVLARVGLVKFGADWTVVGSYQAQVVGFVAKSIRDTTVPTSPGTVTTTETITQSITFQAQSDVHYKVTAIQGVQSNVANDVARAILRYRNAATLTVANSTIITQNTPSMPTAGRGVMYPLIGEISGVSGDVTVATSIVRDTGTGGLISFGQPDRQENLLLVEAM